MTDPFSAVIFLVLFVLFAVILYQGVKNVFPSTSSIHHLAIALSMSSLAAILTAKSVSSLIGLTTPLPILSLGGIIGLILSGMALLVVLMFMSVLIYQGIWYLRLKIREARFDMYTRRHARAERFHDIEEVVPPFEHGTEADTEPIQNDLVLELDLTENS